MSTIIAIGGGAIGDGETIEIDRIIRDRTEKGTPVATFIPTASYDDESYCQNFRQIYGERLDCEVRYLTLAENPPGKEHRERLIKSSDLIYVGGGNTHFMIQRWKSLGLPPLLQDAREKGTVLAGLSAGALCWFDHGHSDSMYYYNPEDWDYIRVECLGFLNGLACPHVESEGRLDDFQNMVRRHRQMGIALGDRTALEVRDDQYRILTAETSGTAYRIVPRQNNEVRTENINDHTSFQTLSKLYSSASSNNS